MTNRCLQTWIGGTVTARHPGFASDGLASFPESKYKQHELYCGANTVDANTVDINVTESHASGVSAKPKLPTSLPDPNNLRDVLAYWMRLHRVQKGWSQERLALECDLDRTYVSAVERSRWNVSLSNIERIALTLGVPSWTLLRPPQEQAQSAAPPRSPVPNASALRNAPDGA